VRARDLVAGQLADEVAVELVRRVARFPAVYLPEEMDEIELLHFACQMGAGGVVDFHKHDVLLSVGDSLGSFSFCTTDKRTKKEQNKRAAKAARFENKVFI
jgi:hypothetical protein